MYIQNKGQILIEVMVALSVVVIAFSGILGLLGTSVALTTTISDRYIGTYLAAEGIEIVKNIIDENYYRRIAFNACCLGSGLTDGLYYMDYLTTSDTAKNINIETNLKYDPSTQRYSYGGPENSRFRREIQIENVHSPQAIRVTSRVFWTGKGGNFEVEVGDVFTKWWGN